MIAPGNVDSNNNSKIGTLTVSSFTNSGAATTTLSFQLGTATNASAATTGSDLLTITDAGNIGYNINNATLTLSVPGTLTANPGDVFLLVNDEGSGAETGTFNGLAQGASVVVGAITFTVDYDANYDSNGDFVFAHGRQ